jgi:hypothetical protein
MHLVQIQNGYAELALQRMSEELDDYHKLKYGPWLGRILWRANLLLRPVYQKLGGR